MTDDAGRRCLVIGEGTMALQCANILLKHGFRVLAVSSPDQPLCAWAASNEVVHVPELSNFIDFARSGSFDYLFSIVNYRILPGSLLAMPSRYAINYHDALLPEFAGTYATSWAIMEGRESHGITWHVMTEGVDEGEILKQVEVPLSTVETAHSLNLKCYYTAIKAFDELAGELKSGTEKRLAQDLSHRTYFEFTKRPPAGCLINFASPANEIDAFVRSLNFNGYPNPLGLPKITLDRKFFAVPEIRVLESASNAAPGTVARLAGDGITVSTQTVDVVIPHIQSLYGTEFYWKELAEERGLSVGTILQPTDANLLDGISRIHVSTCRHERFWTRRLSGLFLPALKGRTDGATASSWNSISARVPESWVRVVDRLGDEACLADALLVSYALFLGDVLQSDLFDLGFHCREFACELEGLDDLFALCVPLRVDLREVDNLKTAFLSTLRQLRLTKERGPYMRDLQARHPKLNVADPLEPLDGFRSRYPICMGVIDSQSAETKFGQQSNFDALANGIEYRWTYNRVQYDDDSAKGLRSQFDEFLDRLGATICS
jgi:methionyl-tRNA formyltransferase